MTWYSEYGQDRWLEENIFKGKTNGVFFEAGALDGLLHSNSLHFEKYNDWTGVLMEANQDLYEEIVTNRHDAVAVRGALWSNNGWMTFANIHGPLFGWSGLTDVQSKSDVDRINRNVSKSDISYVRVPTYTLDSILNRYNLRHIDYLSLDIEGAEYEVLGVFPFKDYDIDVIGVEDNSGCNEELESLLRNNGYQKLIRLGVDDIWRKV